MRKRFSLMPVDTDDGFDERVAFDEDLSRQASGEGRFISMEEALARGVPTQVFECYDADEIQGALAQWLDMGRPFELVVWHNPETTEESTEKWNATENQETNHLVPDDSPWLAQYYQMAKESEK